RICLERLLAPRRAEVEGLPLEDGAIRGRFYLDHHVANGIPRLRAIRHALILSVCDGYQHAPNSHWTMDAICPVRDWTVVQPLVDGDARTSCHANRAARSLANDISDRSSACADLKISICTACCLNSDLD